MINDPAASRRLRGSGVILFISCNDLIKIKGAAPSWQDWDFLECSANSRKTIGPDWRCKRVDQAGTAAGRLLPDQPLSEGPTQEVKKRDREKAGGKSSVSLKEAEPRAAAAAAFVKLQAP